MIIGHTTSNWGIYTILTLLPKYIADYQGYDLKSAGWMSAVSTFANVVSVIVAGLTFGKGLFLILFRIFGQTLNFISSLLRICKWPKSSDVALRPKMKL